MSGLGSVQEHFLFRQSRASKAWRWRKLGAGKQRAGPSGLLHLDFSRNNQITSTTIQKDPYDLSTTTIVSAKRSGVRRIDVRWPIKIVKFPGRGNALTPLTSSVYAARTSCAKSSPIKSSPHNCTAHFHPQLLNDGAMGSERQSKRNSDGLRWGDSWYAPLRGRRSSTSAELATTDWRAAQGRSIGGYLPLPFGQLRHSEKRVTPTRWRFFV
jgi:hypothetical protein